MASSARSVEETRMTLGEHIEELRVYLIRALWGFGAIFALVIYYGKDIVAWLIKPLLHVQFLTGLPQEVIARNVTSGFAVYVKVCLVAALVLSTPWIIYQLWKFVESGLFPAERQVVTTLAPFSGIMVALGVLFMYYVMLPICLAFLIGFSAAYPDVQSHQPSALDLLINYVQEWSGDIESKAKNPSPQTHAATQPGTGAGTTAGSQPQDASRMLIPTFEDDPAKPMEGQIWYSQSRQALRFYIGGHAQTYQPAATSPMRPMIDVETYMDFVLLMTLGIVVAFQVPVLMVVIGGIGLVDPAQLAAGRKYCVFVCFVLGSVLTPADPVSMFVLALPLWALFELGLVLMRRAYSSHLASLEDDAGS